MMANKEQLAMLKRSVSEWNQWRKENPGIIPDLFEARLSDANLEGADLNNAILTYATFSRANLSNAILNKANLSGVSLRWADLIGATIHGASFIEADLRGANLNEADVTGSRFGQTIIVDIDLRSTRGVGDTRHLSPSIVSIDTIFRSQGEIPEIFLRGCGLSDEMISFTRAIVTPLQYYTAFISYNSEDEAFAHRLYGDLQNNNVRCWKYTENVKTGDMILPRVDEAIRLHDQLLLIISEHSLASQWVEHEVLLALDREKIEHRTILFPVRIDHAVLTSTASWAATLRTRLIRDFTGWKHQDAYQFVFQRLLKDLMSDAKQPASADQQQTSDQQ